MDETQPEIFLQTFGDIEDKIIFEQQATDPLTKLPFVGSSFNEIDVKSDLTVKNDLTVGNNLTVNKELKLINPLDIKYGGTGSNITGTTDKSIVNDVTIYDSYNVVEPNKMLILNKTNNSFELTHVNDSKRGPFVSRPNLSANGDITVTPLDPSFGGTGQNIKAGTVAKDKFMYLKPDGKFDFCTLKLLTGGSVTQFINNSTSTTSGGTSGGTLSLIHI